MHVLEFLQASKKPFIIKYRPVIISIYSRPFLRALVSYPFDRAGRPQKKGQKLCTLVKAVRKIG